MSKEHRAFNQDIQQLLFWAVKAGEAAKTDSQKLAIFQTLIQESRELQNKHNIIKRYRHYGRRFSRNEFRAARSNKGDPALDDDSDS